MTYRVFSEGLLVLIRSGNRQGIYFVAKIFLRCRPDFFFGYSFDQIRVAVDKIIAKVIEMGFLEDGGHAFIGFHLQRQNAGQIGFGVGQLLIGDRLLPNSKEEVSQHFLPHAPDKEMNGLIISVFGGVSRISQYQIVVLNLGTQDGVETGNVFAIYQSGDTVRDTINPKKGRTVKLPDERAGTLMVVRPFERISYALVMEAKRDLRVYDSIRNP